MTECQKPNRDEALSRLRELVLDYLGIPRPGAAGHIQQLQDEILPAFMEASRSAWLASSPMPLGGDPIHRHLAGATQTIPNDLRLLDAILAELGVHDLLSEIATSPDAAIVSEIPLDPYEERLLKAVGHPGPGAAVLHYLRGAGGEPALLGRSRQSLAQAQQASLAAHSQINIIINPPASGDAARAKAEQPKRLKLFGGLGKLFSGAVLLGGNAVVVPSVAIGNLVALPVLASFAAGVSAVAEGVSQLRREGE